jgi:hypothetical protein
MSGWSGGDGIDVSLAFDYFTAALGDCGNSARQTSEADWPQRLDPLGSELSTLCHWRHGLSLVFGLQEMAY